MKRANGTGSIVRKKERSNPYLVYAPAKYENGRRTVQYLGSFKRKIDAQNFLDEFNHNPFMYRNRLSFEQVYEEFCQSKRYANISKSSKDCYSAAYKQCSDLKKLSFSEIRTVQMQNIIDRMEREGKSLSSMQKVKVLLKVLYGHAIQSDVVNKNYADYIVLPAVEATSKRALTDDEIEKIRAAAESGNRAAQWTLYLIYSGWRISEMLELTSSSYDAQTKAFRGGKKTVNSKNRLVPVHPAVQYIVEKQLSIGGETVFCMSGGKPMTANYFRNFVFAPMLAELKLDESLTPHVTRHTFATKLKQNGADEFYRKRLLGHASGDVTNDVYTHADIAGLRKAILCLEQPQDRPVDEKLTEALMDVFRKSSVL